MSEVQNRDIYLKLFDESTAHYRHLELVRNGILALYVTLNCGLAALSSVAKEGAPGPAGKATQTLIQQPLAILTLSLISLALYVAVKNIENAKRIHYNIQTSFYEVFGVKEWIDSSREKALTLYAGDKTKQQPHAEAFAKALESLRKLVKFFQDRAALMPYVVMIGTYTIISFTLLRHSAGHDRDVKLLPEICVIVLTTSVFLLVLIDFCILHLRPGHTAGYAPVENALEEQTPMVA